MNQPELISKLKIGDHAAYSDVVTMSQDMVYNTALSIIQHAEDAEDITQEVFIQLFRSVKDFREESSLSTWLYKVTIRKALDAEKAKNRQKRGVLKTIFGIKYDDEPMHFHHPGIQAEQKEDSAILFRAIKKLPENQRIAFTLQKMEGLSQEKIAGILDKSVESVESLLSRAKKNLREMISKEIK